MLKITVGATPGNSDQWFNLSKEARMLKSAVLYADEVEVHSHAFHFVKRTEDAAESSKQLPASTKLNLQEWLVATYYPENKNQIAELRKLQHLCISGNPAGEVADRIKEIVEDFDDTWSELGSRIEEATPETDKIALRKFDELPNVNFVDSLLSGGHINALKQSVNDVQSFPLLDDVSGALIAKLIREGKFTPSPSAAARSGHVGLLANLLESLPEFGDASVDQLLDIRDELEQPLTNFRSKISKLSSKFDSAVWDADFAFDAQRAVLEEIEPEIQEIENAVASNTYRQKLNDRFARKDSLGVLTLGIMSQSATIMAVAALTSAARNAIQAKQEYEEAKEEVKGKSMYFLYGLRESL